MAGPDRRASLGVERRASARLSMPQEDDDSDYDLDAMGISDGFRPLSMLVHGGARNERIPPSRPPSHASATMSTHPPARRATPPPRPSSATKPKALDSFALRHDGGMGALNRNSIASASNSEQRRLSTASTATAAYVRFEAPYQGPSGPSFPYQMYPQESRVARTLSIATNSTHAQVSERSYRGPTGPTHPYGMYPQNTVPEPEPAHVAAPPPIPVGFPGSNNNYQRRLGPEGEEAADMIGPDGHTEQLPPYSKYPDEAFARKNRPAVQSPVDGAGGIGLATRNPEFSSREDLHSPPSRASIRSVSSDPPENRSQSNIAGEGLSEKQELKGWQRVAKRKVCGIVPVWAISLAAVILVLFGIILGATLGILKSKHGQRPQMNGNNGQFEVIATTTTFDAVPFSTLPPGLPALPTGNFALPISAPSAIQNGCLVRSDQSKAWSCALPDSPLQIQVIALSNAADPLASNEMIIDYGNQTFNNSYPYGSQPMVLDDPQVLNLVQDNQEREKGPAWFFQTTYNKIVVVPQDLLSAPGGSKRDLESRQRPTQTLKHHYDALPEPVDFTRRNVAQPGDTPWFCYWNGTLLEAFLYVNLTSSEAAHGATHSAIHSLTSTSTSSSRPTSTSSSSSDSDDDSDDFPPFPPSLWPAHDLLSAYPKVLKFQERRIPRGYQAIPPYCVRRRIYADGSAKDVLDNNGQPVTLYLNESLTAEVMPMLPRALLQDIPEKQLKKVKARQSSIDGDGCGCVWIAS